MKFVPVERNSIVEMKSTIRLRFSRKSLPRTSVKVIGDFGINYFYLRLLSSGRMNGLIAKRSSAKLVRHCDQSYICNELSLALIRSLRKRYSETRRRHSVHVQHSPRYHGQNPERGDNLEVFRYTAFVVPTDRGCDHYIPS